MQLIAQPTIWIPLICIRSKYLLVAMYDPWVHSNKSSCFEMLSADLSSTIRYYTLHGESYRRMEATSFFDASIEVIQAA